jgi:hypothetical protein
MIQGQIQKVDHFYVLSQHGVLWFAGIFRCFSNIVKHDVKMRGMQKRMYTHQDVKVYILVGIARSRIICLVFVWECPCPAGAWNQEKWGAEPVQSLESSEVAASLVPSDAAVASGVPQTDLSPGATPGVTPPEASTSVLSHALQSLESSEVAASLVPSDAAVASGVPQTDLSPGATPGVTPPEASTSVATLPPLSPAGTGAQAPSQLSTELAPAAADATETHIETPDARAERFQTCLGALSTDDLAIKCDVLIMNGFTIQECVAAGLPAPPKEEHAEGWEENAEEEAPDVDEVVEPTEDLADAAKPCMEKYCALWISWYKSCEWLPSSVHRPWNLWSRSLEAMRKEPWSLGMPNLLRASCLNDLGYCAVWL